MKVQVICRYGVLPYMITDKGYYIHSDVTHICKDGEGALYKLVTITVTNVKTKQEEGYIHAKVDDHFIKTFCKGSALAKQMLSQELETV